MRAKPVLRRKSARIDVDLTADRYEVEAGADVALRFVDAAEAAYRLIADRPSAGSSLRAEQLGIAGLRSRPLVQFPYLVFYVEHDEHGETWRVLHIRRDMPSQLVEANGDFDGPPQAS